MAGKSRPRRWPARRVGTPHLTDALPRRPSNSRTQKSAFPEGREVFAQLASASPGLSLSSSPFAKKKKPRENARGLVMCWLFVSKRKDSRYRSSRSADARSVFRCATRDAGRGCGCGRPCGCGQQKRTAKPNQRRRRLGRARTRRSRRQMLANAVAAAFFVLV